MFVMAGQAEIFFRQVSIVRQRPIKPFIFHPVGKMDIFQHNISPQDLAGSGVYKTGAVAAKGRVGRGGPAQHIITYISRIPTGSIRLNLNLEGIVKACFFEGLIPGQYTIFDGLPEFIWCGVFNPPHNGFHRLRNKLLRMFFLQMPAVNQITIGSHIFRVGHIRDLGNKIPHPGIFIARLIIVFRHSNKTVLQGYIH